MASSDVNHLSQPCIYGQTESPCNQRKSGLLKWFSKLFKGSSRGTTNGRRPQIVGEDNLFWHGPSRSLDDRSRAENEDLERAISLSLAEDAKKRNGCKGLGYEGGDFTRTGENLGGLSSFGPYNPNPIQFVPRGFRLCEGCKQEIGYGQYLSCLGTFWHPHCFRCYSCGRPIYETEVMNLSGFSFFFFVILCSIGTLTQSRTTFNKCPMLGRNLKYFMIFQFSLSGSYPYHKTCYKELHHPKCDICHLFIPTNLAGLIEYRAHPFWGQKYCPSHEHDSTPRCCSCERMESRSARYIALGDGRSLCLECLDSAVMDTGECQPLYHAIRDFYEGMYMKIDQQIPMLLVERQALNEAMEGEKDGSHHVPETRGLCLSEEQTVSSIHKKPRIGKNRILDMRTCPQKLIRRCEVTAILVLYGLPRLLTGSILAHELMHGWLRLKGYRNLSPAVEEGICQVLSHMWLESEVMPGPSFAPSHANHASSSTSSTPSYKKGGKSEIEKKLGEFFMHQIAHDISPAYGEGFRMAYAAVNKYGLRRTLDHILHTASFPI